MVKTFGTLPRELLSRVSFLLRPEQRNPRKQFIYFVKLNPDGKNIAKRMFNTFFEERNYSEANCAAGGIAILLGCFFLPY